MPRKNKVKQRNHSRVFAMNNHGDAQIFRNPFTGFDGTDPQISLTHMKEMFKGKLDEDVIVMIFSECGYDVDQALETLISLANDEDSAVNIKTASMPKANSLNNNKIDVPQEIPHLNMKQLSKHFDPKDFLKGAHCISNFKTSQNFNQHFSPESMCNLTVKEDCVDSAQVYNGDDNKDLNMFSESENKAPQSSKLKHNTQNNILGVSSPQCRIQDKRYQIFPSKVETSKNALSFEQFMRSNDHHQFITPIMPNKSFSPGFKPFEPWYATPQRFHAPGVRKFHSSIPNQHKYPIEPLCENKLIMEKIKSGHKVLIILRGLPGSGKSTLGHTLRFSGVVYSTDDYFFKRGRYAYDFRKLNDAHEWNRMRTKTALQKGLSPVIIDNTNIEAWEFAPYVHLGLNHEYQVHILEPNTPWKFNPKELAQRNRHKVKREKIERMLERFQQNVTVENIVKTHHLNNGISDVQETVNHEIDKYESSLTDSAKRNGDCLKLTSLPVSQQSCLKLKAIIHQEDNDANSSLPYSKFNDISNEISETTIDRLNTPEMFENDNSSILAEPKINNLNELRALIQEDSEESQSLSHHTSTSDSNQDVSCWEAITERDDDFLWSTVSTNETENDKSSYAVEEKTNNSFLSNKSESVSTDHNDLIENNLRNDWPTNDGIKLSDSDSKLKCSNNIETERDSLAANKGKIKHASELFLNSHSVKNSHSKLNNDKNKKDNMKMDRDFCTWTANFKIDENNVNRPRSFSSPNCINIDTQNHSLPFNIWPKKDNLEENPNNELNYVPKPQRKKERDSSIIKKNLFESKPIESYKKKSEKIIWESNAFVDSWNESPENNVQLFKNKYSELIEPEIKIVDNNLETDDAIHMECNSVNHKEYSCANLTNSISWPEQSENNCKEDSLENSEANPFKVRSSKRKFAKKTHDNFTSLFKNPFGDDWKFPVFMTPESNNSIDEINLTIKCSSNNSVETQTEPKDFVLIHKIKNKEKCPIDFTVLTPKLQKKEDDVFNCKNEKTVQEHLPLFPTFEKSTSTDDLPCDIEISQKFQSLHECFPDIAEDDLNHLIDICHGDDTWLSNLLLEWGYNFNADSHTNDQEVNVKNSDTLEIKSLSSFKDLFRKSDTSNSKMVLEEDIVVTNSNPEALSETFNILSDKDVFSEVEDNNSSQLKSDAHLKMKNPEDISLLHLSLNPAFALQLEELFGPVGDTSNAPTVEIPLELAKQIHKIWLETMNNVKENKASHIVNHKTNRTASIETLIEDYKFQPLNENESFIKSGTSREPLPLSQIMDMEYALELHKKEKIKRDADFVTKLERQELYHMFPGADTIALDEIFESNNCSLKNSIIALGEDLGYPEGFKKETTEEKEDKVSEMNMLDVFDDFINEDWSNWVFLDEEGAEDTISAEAAQLRDEAALHYNLRKESIKKAQDAYCRGMKEVASFYAQKGNMHGFKFKELNKKASVLIMHQRNIATNNLAIDLHGLYVQEAIPTLERFLKDKKLELKKRRLNAPLTISVITGQGIHSERGPKLRPSVKEFLKKTGYRFTEMNKGFLEVTLVPDHLT